MHEAHMRKGWKMRFTKLGQCWENGQIHLVIKKITNNESMREHFIDHKKRMQLKVGKIFF